MSQQLKFAYGLSTDFALLLEGKLSGRTLDEGTLYFLTDTHEIYKGSTLAVATNFTRVDSLPVASAALSDMFYILRTQNEDGTSEYALKVLNAEGTDFIDIGGSKILKDVTIDADVNTISNLETDNFKTGVVASSVSASSTDTQLASAKAVKDAADAAQTTAINTAAADATSKADAAQTAAINAAADDASDKDAALREEITAITDALTEGLSKVEGAIVGAELVDSTVAGEDKVGIKFTMSDGTTKVIALDEEKFLDAAVLGDDGHTLTLTLSSGDTVEVNLAEMLADATTVKTTESITCTVAVGNLKKGQVISKDTDLQALLLSMLSQDSFPTKTDPRASVTLTSAGAKEVGTEFTPSYNATLSSAGKYTANGVDQASGVTATTYSISDSNGKTSETASGSFDAFTVGDTTSYKVTAVVGHTAGAVPKTYLGKTEMEVDGVLKQTTEVQIQAGTKTATSTAVTGYRAWFTYIGTDTATIDAAWIRSKCTNQGSAKSIDVSKIATYNSTKKGTTIPAGTKRVVIALPDGKVDGTAIASNPYTKTLKGVTDIDGMGLGILDKFPSTSIAIEGLNGYDAMTYNVYVFENANGVDATTFGFTIS